MASLNALLNPMEVVEIKGAANVEISGLQYDSRRVKPRDAFVCIEGFKTDGHRFIPQAVSAGAGVIVVQKDISTIPGVTVVKVKDSRKALAEMAAAFYGYPSRSLNLVGVTGTNGKTTTTYLIKQILGAMGQKTGLIGTIANLIGDQALPVSHTTPESLELQQLLRDMNDVGCSYSVMEVSSHALDLQRVVGCEYDIAVFTNLTQDHLDYHGTFDHYFQSKLRLFTGLGYQTVKKRSKIAVVNRDDPYGEKVIRACPPEVRLLTYAINNPADIRAREIEVKPTGTTFLIAYPGGETKLRLNLTGYFNVYNTLAAFAVGWAEGFPANSVVTALHKLQGVPGRFELVTGSRDFGVIVDYAHTPDGLENILTTARKITTGRVITVFGCGGDRDRTKRPLMGAVAARLGDYTVITSDNPRSEPPQAIINEIEPGVSQAVGPDRYRKVVDRRQAIREAIMMARPGDLVIIAGKGHEDYQIIGNQVIAFDDREVAREILAGPVEADAGERNS